MTTLPPVAASPAASTASMAAARDEAAVADRQEDVFRAEARCARIETELRDLNALRGPLLKREDDAKEWRGYFGLVQFNGAVGLLVGLRLHPGPVGVGLLVAGAAALVGGGVVRAVLKKRRRELGAQLRPLQDKNSQLWTELTASRREVTGSRSALEQARQRQADSAELLESVRMVEAAHGASGTAEEVRIDGDHVLIGDVQVPRRS